MVSLAQTHLLWLNFQTNPLINFGLPHLIYIVCMNLQIVHKSYFGAHREVDQRVGAKLNGGTVFLRRGEKRENLLLVSYPRSGNSFLRKRLEACMGIATGSDSRPNRTLSRSLLRCGFIGEGVADESVFTIKSHFPERQGYVKFAANRVILVVRNPFDCIESYFHMGFTNTHDRTLSQDAKARLADVYDDFVEKEARVWHAFHKYWLSIAEKSGVPIKIVRFEDLVSEGGERIINDIYAFAAPCSYSGARSKTAFQSRGADGYVPRGGVVGAALQHMTDEQVAKISQPNQELLRMFNYEVKKCDSPATTQSQSSSLSIQPSLRYMLLLHDTPFTDGFVTSSVSETAPDSGVEEAPTLTVNDGYNVRKEGELSKYGRNMTYIRRSFTDEDRNPFPLAPRKTVV